MQTNSSYPLAWTKVMLRRVRNHPGAFGNGPFAVSALAALIHIYLSGGVVSILAWQIGMWGAALALVTALLVHFVNPYVKRNLPSEIQEKKWIEMNEEEFSECKFFGIAGLLIDTTSIAIFSSVLGWLLALSTVFFLTKGNP